jgi:hypothetical protein
MKLQKDNQVIKVVVILAILLVFLISCNNTSSSISVGTTSTTTFITSSSPSETASSSTTTTSSPTSTSPDTSSSTVVDLPAITLQLTLSNAPKLGETAEMEFILQTNSHAIEDFPPGLEKAHAWIEFYWTNINGSYSEAVRANSVPSGEVLISGELDWEGNYNIEQSLNLYSQIQLPREGIWQIKGFLSGEGWKNPREVFKFVAVADGTAAFLHMQELKSSPLAYLGNFTYGGFLDFPYFPYIGYQQIFLNEFQKVWIEADISRLPLVDEQVTLTCSIISSKDIPDFSAEVKFRKEMELFGPVSGVLVNGELKWSGDLKAYEPVQWSAVISFKEEGHWEIYLGGNSLENTQNHIGGVANNIEITIGSMKSYFGWPEPQPPSVTRTITFPTTTRTPDKLKLTG